MGRGLRQQNFDRRSPVRSIVHGRSYFGNFNVFFLLMAEWHKKANCRFMGPSLFYSDKHRACRIVCGSCSVVEECWQDSIKTEPIDQMWGYRAGRTAAERQRERVRKNIY
jgi:hypothetical protein|tara:strand:+ start:3425 stop:3754 length:330 start_codon:yes stop_codon:yes gene_type:complete